MASTRKNICTNGIYWLHWKCSITANCRITNTYFRISAYY
uniref:Uncharacterized protein n=1 Tax=Anguilla anguilla TaxID=7936 RepID=A0A0E9W0B9_ANGAN